MRFTEFYYKQDSMKKTVTLLVLLFLCTSTLAAKNQKSDGDWWKKVYGEITWQENTEVLRARRIFNNLWQALQPSSMNPPRLIVIPESADKWLDSWALTLRDGSVILVKSVLDLSFGNGDDDKEIGDSRLGFVLAHELAHLANHDHERTGSTMLFQSLLTNDEVRVAREIEYAADRLGLFLMTMAGYDPKTISGSKQISFFIEYEKKVRKKIRSIGKVNQSSKYPQTTQRAEKLLKRLQVFSEELHHFSEGVQWYQQGDFKKAANEFLTFSKWYAGREVLNNLGLSYFQQARQKVIGCQDSNLTYTLFTKLDTETRAKKLKPEQIGIVTEKINCQKDRQYKKLLTLAKKQYQLSILKDPDYATVYINLSAYLITVEDYPRAVLEADKVLSKNKKNWSALNNKSIALYLADPTKNKIKAMKQLAAIPLETAPYETARHNLSLMGGGEKTGMEMEALPTTNDLLDIIKK